jgi:hypothetical protein
MNLVTRSSELIAVKLNRSNAQLRSADQLALEQAQLGGGNIFVSPGRAVCHSSDSPLRSASSLRDSSSACRQSDVSRAVILCSRTEQPVERKLAATGFGLGTVGLGCDRISALGEESATAAINEWKARRDQVSRADQQKLQAEKSALLKKERERHGRGGAFNALRDAIDRSVYRKLQALREDKAKQCAEKKVMQDETRAYEAARLAYVREEMLLQRQMAEQKRERQAEMRDAMATMGWLHLEARARSRADSVTEAAHSASARRSTIHEIKEHSLITSSEAATALRQRVTDSASTVRKVLRRCRSAIEASRAVEANAAHELTRRMRKEHANNMFAVEDLLDREHLAARRVVTAAHRDYEAKKREREEQREAKAAVLRQERLLLKQ